MDPQGRPGATSGVSVDVSVYGLGVVVPVPLPAGTEVTVLVHGIETCGSARVRHSQPCPSGFRVGLHFELTLFMQNIPGLDEILVQSLRCAHEAKKVSSLSILQRIALRLVRATFQKQHRQKSPIPTATH
jgi:hypothetical protein